MSRQIPQWARKLGILGVVLFTVYFIFKFVINVVLQAEIENWWNTQTKPWLVSKMAVGTELYGWQIVLIGFVLVMLISAIPVLSRFGKNQNPLVYYKRGKAPVYNSDAGLNTSDIVSAIVSTRNGMMKPEDLSMIIVSALNNSLINKETATKTLGEFGYDLIYLGNDKYSSNKSGVNHE